MDHLSNCSDHPCAHSFNSLFYAVVLIAAFKESILSVWIVGLLGCQGGPDLAQDNGETWPERGKHESHAEARMNGYVGGARGKDT